MIIHNLCKDFGDKGVMGVMGMSQRSYLLFIGSVIFTIIMLCGCSYNHLEDKIIKDNDITKITLYKNWDKEGPFVIKDRKVIRQIIQKINSSPRRDISKIAFERGADGRMIFEGKNSIYKMGVFSDSGNIVTKKYYIHTALNLME
ncbi:hypothetical protein QFZ87_000702 [Bacillus sp. SLBN-46]|uniref:hypothetical protein n=1 Tax=Bacillus sp. SLBN-46 TaxID=3042283 RepID=UPI00285B67AC|nr:hypothetical protein [Bacillus sp. SLBN-46]MDR6121105.1 hypothetical protein [Bacillus sp. SLBN-46]